MARPQTIKFGCSCGRQIAVPLHLAGRETGCPACGRTLLVPQPSTRSGPHAIRQGSQTPGSRTASALSAVPSDMRPVHPGLASRASSGRQATLPGGGRLGWVPWLVAGTAVLVAVIFLVAFLLAITARREAEAARRKSEKDLSQTSQRLEESRGQIVDLSRARTEADLAKRRAESEVESLGRRIEEIERSAEAAREEARRKEEQLAARGMTLYPPEELNLEAIRAFLNARGMRAVIDGDGDLEVDDGDYLFYIRDDRDNGLLWIFGYMGGPEITEDKHAEIFRAIHEVQKVRLHLKFYIQGTRIQWEYFLDYGGGIVMGQILAAIRHLEGEIDYAVQNEIGAALGE